MYGDMPLFPPPSSTKATDDKTPSRGTGTRIHMQDDMGETCKSDVVTVLTDGEFGTRMVVCERCSASVAFGTDYCRAHVAEMENAMERARVAELEWDSEDYISALADITRILGR